MTTIAWDGKTLAADRQSTYNGTATPTTKIFRVVKHGRAKLFGCAGDSGECQAYARWMRRGGKKPALSDIAVLTIDHKGRVFVMSDKWIIARVRVKKWALGSGTDFAMGAMFAGADAEKAVHIATVLDTKTGLGVDTLTL